MNVTILVPPSLKSAMDGRQSVDLGVPATAGIGDVMEVLFKLYPRLRAHLASERKGSQQQLHVFLGDQAGVDPRRRMGLREGQKLYLFASAPRRLAAEVV